MIVSKHHTTEATGSIQVCAEQEAGSEAAIHAIYDNFKSPGCRTVLFVDSENTLNSINRAAILQNIDILCQIISTFIKNSYSAHQGYYKKGRKSPPGKEQHRRIQLQ